MKRQLDYSHITANLFVGRTPYGKEYRSLQSTGVTLIVNMRAEWPSRIVARQNVVNEIWLPSIDSRYLPINQKKLLTVARRAASEIQNGGKVYVYCRMGRHRSVVMSAAILLLLGHDMETVLKLIPMKRPVADLRAIQVAKAITEFEKASLQ